VHVCSDEGAQCRKSGASSVAKAPPGIEPGILSYLLNVYPTLRGQ